ncbi:MAG: hypothetical protein IT340_06255 [Chloroflexi bacterium]|nr:hypothetical protein [Chloroflexota bacterium]
MPRPESPWPSAAAIDAAFEAMAQDEEYQAEAAQIMHEFEQADWEAWQLAEQQ